MNKFLLFFALAALSACSNLQFPGVYKITVEQGNIITQEMVDQLKPGMSKEQVEYIMGSPLIKDSFNGQRWDYVYNIQKGDEPREQYRMSIFFKADSLSHFTGDFIPSSAQKQAANTDSENPNSKAANSDS